MNSSNDFLGLKETKLFTIKSGSKTKSIHAYISKICDAFSKFESLEVKAMVTIIEILKRKLTNFNHKFEICWDNITNSGTQKLSCMKAHITINSEFLKENENNLKYLKECQGKREIIKCNDIQTENNIEKTCIDNINEMFKN